jgi:signal transduction histidine kinase/CheY-like chemotaxis protein
LTPGLWRVPRVARLLCVIAVTALACGRNDPPPAPPEAQVESGATPARVFLTLDTMSMLATTGGSFTLDAPWRFRLGDDASWSSPHVDDSGWGLLDPRVRPPDSIFDSAWRRERDGQAGVAWFRMHIMADPALHSSALGLLFSNAGAAEIYLDGRRIHSFGDVAAPGRTATIRMGSLHPANTIVLNRTESLLAVRMNIASADHLMRRGGSNLFELSIEPPQTQAARIHRASRESAAMIVLGGTLGALGLVHLLLFAFLRRPRSNLYFGAFAILLATAFCLSSVLPVISDDGRLHVALTTWIVLPAQLLALPALLAFLYSTFNGYVPRHFGLILLASLLFFIAFASRLVPPAAFNVLTPLYFAILAAESLRITVLAVLRRRPGALIVGTGAVLMFGLALYAVAVEAMGGTSYVWLPVIAFGSLAVAGSIHLAQRFALASTELEQLTEHLEEEVQQRTQDLEEATLAAESANRTKSQFLANMSHELRTPLNAIIGYSEMLVEEAEDLGHKQFVPDLRKIHTSGRHLLGLINDVLDLSKIEAGRMELFLEHVDIADIVGDVATTVKPLIERNGNRLHISVAADAGTMLADQVKLRQILVNLLSNAAKFTQAGTVQVTVARQSDPGSGDRIRFTVSDTGIGMTDEQRAKLFQPFMQADASTTKRYGGTGLGLSITKRFVELMAGSISTDSVAGRGTTFVVDLPAEVPEQAPEPAAQPTAAAGTIAAPGDPSAGSDGATPAGNDGGGAMPAGATILVIDDDASARDMLSRVLLREGYRVITAADGTEGLRLARTVHPALITLDIMMRGLDGWGVLSQLRSDPALVDVPVVVVTVVDDRGLGFALGATEYLTKPIDRERLVGVLQRTLGNPSAGSLLVVEDDEDTREMLRRLLQKQGWTVLEAANGREALDVVASSPPALVLLDLMMPEMDGFEFLRRFRRAPATEHIPVVVLTAKELTSDDIAELEGAVTRVLQKGAHSGDDILQEIRRQLVRGATTPALGS